ncbi:unnamed protein product [Clonostachys rhizophaga]|uniref:Uncharacterized protein n=1 Tax=Clonostachys rhizophaga TaxID=160324 RepID=A0A9N9VPN9_9HYPO|nr:unnamed protein product [Clonostachys rhizophaga]
MTGDIAQFYLIYYHHQHYLASPTRHLSTPNTMSSLFQQRAPEGCRSDAYPPGIDNIFNPELKFAWTAWTNGTEIAVRTCCEDSPIIVYKECWLACELPDSIQKNITKDVSAGLAFSRCVDLNWPENRGQPTLSFGGTRSSPAMPSAAVPNLGHLVLLVFGLLCLMR